MQIQSLVNDTLKPFRRPRAATPRHLRPPPVLSGGLPVVGHTVEFVRSAIDVLYRAQRELGEIAAFQVAHLPLVGMFGPEAHEAVFRAPDTQLSPSEAYKMMVPVFGKDIVYDAPPEKMNEQLRMLLPALKDRRMRAYGEIILKEVEESIAGWGDEGEVDLVDYCRVLTNFTSSHCLLGREFREGMSEEFAQVYHDLERGITPVAYINHNLPLPSFRKRDRARVRLVQMITQIVEDRRRSGRTGEDFLQTLMDAKYKNGASLTEHEITGMLLASMFAGHHTSSVTTAWTLLELLQNPYYLMRVLEELDTVYADDAPVSYESLRETVATELAVKETLRLHPPLFMLMRGVVEDFTYKEWFIPKGSFIVVSPTVAHRIPEVFRDPHRFDPDRFLAPREEDRRLFTYIAFGGGRHKCMGNAFAILQVKAILAVLLRRYEFELAGDPIDSDFHGLVVGPKQPCRLRYRRRTHRLVTRPASVKTDTAVPDTASGCPAHAPAEPETPPRPFRVRVDTDLCQGHAVCIEEVPEVFKVVDHRATLLTETPPVELRRRVETAIKYCPTRALSLVDLPD